MEVLTKPQKRMLDLVRKTPGRRPQFYAGEMWPERDNSHQNARNASMVLWRLKYAGLVEQYKGFWSPVVKK